MGSPRKIVYDNTPDNDQNRICSYYKNMYTYKQVPISKAIILQFCLDFVNEVSNDETIVVQEKYLEKKGMGWKSFTELRKKHEELEEAYDFVKMIMGNRREEKALTKQFDTGMVERSMPMYKDSWKELIEWKAKMADKLAESQGLKVVHIPQWVKPDAETKDE